ncbi:hypothetical protein D1872_215930 [compost metagenome]
MLLLQFFIIMFLLRLERLHHGNFLGEACLLTQCPVQFVLELLRSHRFFRHTDGGEHRQPRGIEMGIHLGDGTHLLVDAPGYLLGVFRITPDDFI